MSKIEKVGGTLVVSAGLFFGLTYFISGSDVQQPLAGQSAVGGGSGVNSSKSSDSLGMGQIESADGASLDRRVSEFSGGATEDFQTQPSAAGEQIHIGSFIDPDRGADLSEDTIPIHIGDYIDPDRGPDFTERPPIHIGEYMDPDAEGSDTSDPKDVIRIGEFIDPDGAGTTATEKRIEIFTKASGALPE